MGAGELEQFKGFPSSGVGESFQNSQNSANDYAMKSADLSLRRDELERQHQQMMLTMQQHRIQTSLKVIGDWDDINKELPGPVQNAKLRKLQANYAVVGLPWDPIMEAMVKDDNGRAALTRSLGLINKVPDEMKGQLAEQAYKLFGRAEGDKAIKSINDNASAIEQIHARGQEERATQASKLKAELPFKEREFGNQDRKWLSEEKQNLKTSKPFEAYSENRVAIRNIMDATQKPGPFKDFAAIDNLARQVNPNAVVRQGTYDIIDDTKSLPQKFVSALNRMWHGQPLTAELRQEILQASGMAMNNAKKNYDDLATPYRENAKKRGFDPTEVDPAATMLDQDQKWIEAHTKRNAKQMETEAKNPPPPVLSAGTMMRLKKFVADGRSRKEIESALGTTIHPEIWKKVGGKED